MEFAATLRPGSGCWCPLAAATAKRQGVVLGRKSGSKPGKTQAVGLDTGQRAVLSPELLRLVSFLKETTFCSYFDAVKAILPGGIGYRMRYDYGLSPLWNGEEKPLEEDERKLVSYLENKKGMVPGRKTAGAVGPVDREHIAGPDAAKRDSGTGGNGKTANER